MSQWLSAVIASPVLLPPAAQVARHPQLVHLVGARRRVDAVDDVKVPVKFGPRAAGGQGLSKAAHRRRHLAAVTRGARAGAAAVRGLAHAGPQPLGRARGLRAVPAAPRAPAARGARPEPWAPVDRPGGRAANRAAARVRGVRAVAYAQHLAPYRTRNNVTLLEIGANTGDSLYAWSEYFREPGATIWGMRYGVSDSRMKTKAGISCLPHKPDMIFFARIFLHRLCPRLP